MWTISIAGLLYASRSFSDSDPLPRPKFANVLAMFRHPNFPRTALFFAVLRMDMNLSNALLPVLGIIVLGGAVELGASATVVAAASIAFTLLSHRHRSPETRSRFARLGFALEIAAFVAAIVAVASPSPVPAAYFACVLVLPFAKSISGPVTGLYELRAAEILSSSAEDRGMESVVFRDTIIALGRLAFLGVLVAIHAAYPDMRVLLASGFALWIASLLLQSALIRSLDPRVSATGA